MERCIELALRGAGKVAPNPMVGSVLVHDHMIIGEGYHEQYGGPHAEVNGRGIRILREAGVEVESGILEAECKDLNKRFFFTVQQQRPYIILKWAATSNGMIASDDDSRLMISNALSNRLVHRWRAEEEAIMVGTNTALADEPSLNVRHWTGKSPVRVVIDRHLRLPGNLKLFDQSVPTIVLNSIKDDKQDQLQYVKLRDDFEPVNSIVAALQELKIQSVLVEGGSALLQSFINAGYWNEARVIINETLTVSNGLSAPQLTNADVVKTEQVGTERIHYFIRQTS